MKIISLEAENFKRLKAIRIEPTGAAVIIGGKNMAGKSSALDAIRAALGGKKNCPEEPIRKGAKKAEIILETDELTARRTFSKKGTQIEVTAKDGSKFNSPQAMLDELIGTLSFDPLEFSRMKPAEQAETVRKLAGLDFSQLEEKRADLYTQRTDVGRDLKQARAILADRPTSFADVETPDEEISIKDAVAELEAIRSHNAANDKQRNALIDATNNRAKAQALVGNVADKIHGLKKELQLLQSRLVEDEANEEHIAAEVNKLEDKDPSEIQEKIDSAEEVNGNVRAKHAHKKAKQEVEDTSKRYQEITRGIDALDQEKAEAIQAVKYPIDGLVVTDEGIELGGVPFLQASSAEQLRCSVAMGLALHSGLKVLLCKDGSLLDSDNLELVAKMAADADAQVWIERVGAGSECSVVIEDGEIAAPEK